MSLLPPSSIFWQLQKRSLAIQTPNTCLLIYREHKEEWSVDQFHSLGVLKNLKHDVKNWIKGENTITGFLLRSIILILRFGGRINSWAKNEQAYVHMRSWKTFISILLMYKQISSFSISVQIIYISYSCFFRICPSRHLRSWNMGISPIFFLDELTGS